jgi:TM2 domain-containing membrane protein YozV
LKENEMEAAVNALPPETPSEAPAPERVPPPLPVAPAAPLGTTEVPRPKVPGLALFLSFLMPGVGQLYNGQVAKGFVFFFAFVGCIVMTAESGPQIALMIPFVFFYNLIDAWQSATRINQQALGGEVVSPALDEHSPAWGIALVAMGLLFLFRNLGWISMAWVTRWWPLALVGAGAVFVYRSLQRGSHVGD